MPNARLVIISGSQILEGYFAGNWSKQPGLRQITTLQGSVAGFARELRAPCVWVCDGVVLKEIDLLLGSATGRAITLDQEPVSIQVDVFTGDIWVGYKTKLLKIAYPGVTPTEFAVFSSGVGIGLLDIVDLKMDSFRRKIWISDADAGKIYRADLATGAVDREGTPTTYSKPAAMGLDQQSGNVYVRCQNPINSEEAIFLVSDSGAEKQWESPETIVDTPLTNSIVVDHARNQIWWVTPNYVVMANADSQSGRAMAVEATSTGQSLDVALNTGCAYVLASETNGASIYQVDVGNRNIVSRKMLQETSDPSAIFLEQTFQPLLAGHFSINSPTSNSNSITATFSINTPGSISLPNGPSLSEDLAENDDYVPSVVGTTGPYQAMAVWSNQDNGVEQVGLTREHNPLAGNPTPSVLRLPRFSWTSTPWVYRPAIAIGRPDGDVEIWNIDLDADGYPSGMTKGNFLEGTKLPPGRSNIQKLIAATDKTSLFASTGQYVVELDADFVTNIGCREIQGVAWSADSKGLWVADAAGWVDYISEEEESSQSHSSQSSTPSSVSSSTSQTRSSSSTLASNTSLSESSTSSSTLTSETSSSTASSSTSISSSNMFSSSSSTRFSHSSST